MSNILAEIYATKRSYVDRCKQKMSLADIESAAQSAPPIRGFIRSLDQAVSEHRFGLIAEIKKASPSKGLIRADFRPDKIARAYELGGAACLSVLTDQPYFQGADAYLQQARTACTVPVIRKDFMCDPYQVIEARALGSDCILIIMAMLDDVEAGELESAALELGMDVLIEVHNEAEMERAINMRSPLLGVNNRDLKTFEVDISTTERLSAMAPKDRILVGESGLSKHSDLKRLAKSGVTRFLIGESLMRQTDITAATRAILG